MRKARIADVTASKPWLQLIEGSVCRIPERLKEIDNGIFVVRNTKKGIFEAHCLNNYGDTYAFTIPFDELDTRAIEFYYRTNLRLHGKKIYDAIRDKNIEQKKRNRRHRDNELETFAHELYPEVRKKAQEGGFPNG